MPADGEEPPRTCCAAPSRVAVIPMTVRTATLSSTGDGPGSRAPADELLDFAADNDFARWEQQLSATGNCANPVRLHGRIDAIDWATGEIATIYDTASEPGGVLRIP